MQESSSGHALFSGKCPACRKGDIFKYPLKRITRFSEMHKHCLNCGASFEPEPGFYFGAMFVSYGLSVMLFIAIWLTLYIFWDPSDFIYVTVIGLGAVLFTPISFRFSRIVYLYMLGGLSYHHPRSKN
ncbi:MAG: DUF983 domain-containing protein [Bacteroidia bacterium]|nr:DUF983 domain-containing protein [Bacteroidia bacterium]